MEETKKCSRCGEVKPLSAFALDGTSKDGHQAICKVCHSAIGKEHYVKNKNRYIEARKRRDSDTAAWLKTCDEHPSQDNARKCARAAVKEGVIEQPKRCQICGKETTKLEMHHHCYAQPLDVIWVCSPCHQRADQMRRIYERGGYANRSRNGKPWEFWENAVIRESYGELGAIDLAPVLKRTNRAIEKHARELGVKYYGTD